MFLGTGLGGWRWLFVPRWGAAPDDGESHVLSSTVDLIGGQGHWAFLHEAVDEKTGVDPAVVAVELLGHGVPCTAYERPGTLVGAVEDAQVFVEDEFQALCGVFAAVFTNGGFWDMGV